MSTFRAYLVTPKAGRPRQWLTVAAEAGKLARELEGDAQPYELPATKGGLIPFLNTLEAEHAIALEAQAGAGDVAELEQPIDDGRPWEKGPKTKEPPRYAVKWHGHVGRTEFVPIDVSAAIAASYGACPKCQRTWAAQVQLGIASADTASLEAIAASIARQLEERAQA